jgi:hypothetical protein
MVKLLLALAATPSPHDAADALAVALCHAHSRLPVRGSGRAQPVRNRARSWRAYRPGPETT